MGRGYNGSYDSSWILEGHPMDDNSDAKYIGPEPSFLEVYWPKGVNNSTPSELYEGYLLARVDADLKYPDQLEDIDKAIDDLTERYPDILNN